MEIVSFDAGAGRAVEAFGSAGVSAQALFRGETVAVTVLRVAAGGEIGRHPAPVDQLLVVVEGHGFVRGGDGEAEAVRAGQAVVWRAGEEHVTRAVEDITAVAIEMA
ncbi:cupin domain-containing protein [Winogradskya humida]|uniref:cupin domain-containing protein n=1 Tax=Winogradskya humida TaxID=113566 RepID=UPI001945AC52|nr:cupin domain-containing protein [Actinoplanes humidus]